MLYEVVVILDVLMVVYLLIALLSVIEINYPLVSAMTRGFVCRLAVGGTNKER